MEGGTRLADPGDYLLAQCRARPAMPVGGRINREQERVSAGPGHRAVERRLDRTDQLLALRPGPAMIAEVLDQRMLDRIAPLAEPTAALDRRDDPVDLQKPHKIGR